MPEERGRRGYCNIRQLNYAKPRVFTLHSNNKLS